MLSRKHANIYLFDGFGATVAAAAAAATMVGSRERVRKCDAAAANHHFLRVRWMSASVCACVCNCVPIRIEIEELTLCIHQSFPLFRTKLREKFRIVIFDAIRQNVAARWCTYFRHFANNKVIRRRNQSSLAGSINRTGTSLEDTLYCERSQTTKCYCCQLVSMRGRCTFVHAVTCQRARLSKLSTLIIKCNVRIFRIVRICCIFTWACGYGIFYDFVFAARKICSLSAATRLFISIE